MFPVRSFAGYYCNGELYLFGYLIFGNSVVLFFDLVLS